jgi:hypothetical protein
MLCCSFGTWLGWQSVNMNKDAEHAVVCPPRPALPAVQVIRCALENACSVAKTFLLADVVVT